MISLKLSKIFTSFFLSLCFVVNTYVVYAFPVLTSRNAILMDFETLEVLHNHNAHETTYPASTTKVLTAILVLENLNLSDTITVDYDIFVPGSSMYLLNGESFTVYELLQALMIRSANDVAELFAIHISNSVETFAELMNERAKELGALNSNFTNPHGLPDEAHVTTAYDLALIAKYAMSFDTFREIVSTTTLNFEPTEFTPGERIYRNTNRFLWGTGGQHKILYNNEYIDIYYDIVDGIKTGYTGAAKNCLIATAIKEDHRLIAVVLGADGSNVYLDSRTLLDYGFDNFTLQPLVEGDEFITDAIVINGVDESVPLFTAREFTTVLPKSADLSKIEKSILLKENIEAPITDGEFLGSIIYSLDGKILQEIPLIAGTSIEFKQPSIIISEDFLSFKTIAIILASLFVFWQIIIVFLRRKKRKRRRTANNYLVPSFVNTPMKTKAYSRK